jgi:Holliday junction resolvase RusA-like endonuclease
MYELIISGTPVPKARPRGFKTKKGNIAFYTPKHSKDFEYEVRRHAEEKFKAPMTCPVRLSVTFLLPRPKRLYWKTKAMPRVAHTSRPDIDNLVKSCTDGLNGIAYIDDAQITELKAIKRYHSGDEGPRTIIRIEEDGF